MSLVNDMLRDLDERKREGSTGYRAVAKANTGGRWLWMTLVIALLVLILFFVVSGWQQDQAVNVVDATGIKSADTENIKSSAKPNMDDQQVSSVEIPRITAEPKSEKEIPVVTNINVINWTAQSSQRGTLTFWLDQVKPFVLYERTDTTLDISIVEANVTSELPDIESSLLSTIEAVPEVGNSRFKLVATGLVEFKPHLKQNPARLVIDVISTEPVHKISKSHDVSLQPLASREKVSVSSVLADNVAANEATVVVANIEEKAGQSQGDWKKSLNTLPTDSSTVRSAQRLLSQQRTDEALALLKNYIAKAPSSLQSQYLLAQLYLATERYTAALQILHNAPNNLSWSLLKARAMLQQGQAQQAILLLEQHPDGLNRQDYLELLASGYQQSGQHAAAVARYLSLLGLDSQQGRWWINLGISLEHLGQKEKALDAYRSALQIPDLDQSLKQYAQLQSQRLMQSQ